MPEAAQLQTEHQLYQEYSDRWRLVRDFYEAEVLARPRFYLEQYKPSEGAEEFAFRAKNADYTNHLARIIDGFSGMLFSVEGEAMRQTQAEDSELGLGHLDDPDTVMGQIGRNISGDGTDYLTQWRVAAPLLLVYHQLWGVIVAPEAGLPQHKILRPEAVTDWLADEDGRLLEVMVKETVRQRGSLLTTPVQLDYFTHYTLEGFTQYSVRTEGESRETEVVDEGQYELYDSPDRMRRILPVYRVRLPLPRYVAWTLAKKAKAIFNAESQRDHILSVAQMPLFLFNDEMHDFDSFVQQRRQGHNVVAGAGHEWLTVDSGPAEISTRVINEKTQDLYHTAFQEYSDSARQATATEMRQEFSQGIASFLELYKNSLDEYENQFLRRLEQVQFPQRPDLWGQAHVKRSSDFHPADEQELADRLSRRYFGSRPVPVSASVLAQFAKHIARQDGAVLSEEDEAEIEDAARVMADSLDQEADASFFA